MKVRFLGEAKRRLVPAAAITVALFVPLAVLGGPALARSAATAAEYEYGHHGKSDTHEHGSPAGTQYGPSGTQYSPSGKQYRVTICHRTHSRKHPWVQLTVNWHALKAHVRHGDVTTLPCPTTIPDSTTKHEHHSSNGDGQGEPNGQGSDQNTGQTSSLASPPGEGHGHGFGHGHDKNK